MYIYEDNKTFRIHVAYNEHVVDIFASVCFCICVQIGIFCTESN